MLYGHARTSLSLLVFLQRKRLGLRTVGDDAQKRGASDNPLDSVFPLGAWRCGRLVLRRHSSTTHSRGCVPGAWCRAARVKKLMKLDKDCKHVSKDAIALTAVATVRCSHSPRAAACVDPPQERHVAVNRRRSWRTWRVRRGGVLARDRRSSTRTLVGALRSGHLSPLAACLT